MALREGDSATGIASNDSIAVRVVLERGLEARRAASLADLKRYGSLNPAEARLKSISAHPLEKMK